MLPGVGVFGTSLTARVIIPLLKDEGFAVKALWGRTQEEAEELAKEMSVPFYTSRIDEVLLHQDVDLVCINLPPPLTRQIAVKTLELGHQRKKKQQEEISGKNNAVRFCSAELLLPPAHPCGTFVYPPRCMLLWGWGGGGVFQAPGDVACL
ncbi:glucose-fructose oxidoreductase domain-containing protein 1 isoform 3 precursor, partial [Daubentonia madagascariensis]